ELAQQRASLGDLAGAVADAKRAVAADPLREPAHCLLIRLYAIAGRRPEALRQYRELERILREEIGTTPSAGTQALLRQVESGDANAVGVSMEATSGVSDSRHPAAEVPRTPTHLTHATSASGERVPS